VCARVCVSKEAKLTLSLTDEAATGDPPPNRLPQAAQRRRALEAEALQLGVQQRRRVVDHQVALDPST
jgi:hypothetical protein